MTTDVDHFTDSLDVCDLPDKDLSKLLDYEGLTQFRSNNGCLSYALNGGFAGKVAVSRRNFRNPTGRDLKFSNTMIEEIQSPENVGTLRYPFLQGDLKPTVVFDSSYKSVDDKCSQGAYMVLLQQHAEGGDCGRKSYVLEFSTRKSTLVARSSFAAELAANRASEAASRISSWLRGIRRGVESARELLNAPNLFPV